MNPKTCPICKRQFTPRHPGQTYCRCEYCQQVRRGWDKQVRKRQERSAPAVGKGPHALSHDQARAAAFLLKTRAKPTYIARTLGVSVDAVKRMAYKGMYNTYTKMADQPAATVLDYRRYHAHLRKLKKLYRKTGVCPAAV